MRPINSRERRLQFLKFLALFALAVLPIVLLVHAHGYVDQVENRFLREQYAAKKESMKNENEYNRHLNELVNNVGKLKGTVQAKKDGMETSDYDMSGDIDVEVRQVVDGNNTFKSSQQSAADTALVKIVSDVSYMVGELNKVYRTKVGKVYAQTKQLEAKESELINCNKERKECLESAILRGGG